MFPAEAEWGDVGTGPGQRGSSACRVVAGESEGLSASRTEGEAQPVSATREQTSVVSSGRWMRPVLWMLKPYPELKIYFLEERDYLILMLPDRAE